jgi:hypothetical protein
MYMCAVRKNGYMIGVHSGMGRDMYLDNSSLTSILRCHLLRNGQSASIARIYPSALRCSIVRKPAAAVYVTMHVSETD